MMHTFLEMAHGGEEKAWRRQACKYVFYNQYVCVNIHAHVQRDKVYSLLILNLMVFNDKQL